MRGIIERGQTIELTYPDVTLVEALARFERRRIRVHMVRDLVADPLTPPSTCGGRSCAALVGLSTDTTSIDVWRKFYVGSSVEYSSPGALRVALYRHGETRPADVISRDFGPPVASD